MVRTHPRLCSALLKSLTLFLCLLVCVMVASSPTTPTARDEEALRRAFYEESDDSLDALEAFDRTLNETVARLERMDQKEAPLLGRVAVLYWERDLRWQLGGLREALRYVVEAMDLTPWERLEEKFAWTLQRGAIEARLGMQAEARLTFELALNLSKFTDYRDRASVQYHYGSMLLENGREADAKQAHALFNESLRLDPCSAEAPLGRVRLVQAFALIPPEHRFEKGMLKHLRFLKSELEAIENGGCLSEVALDLKLQQSITPGLRLSPAIALTHWALFIAEDTLGGDPGRAWQHLETAVSIDANGRGEQSIAKLLEDSELASTRAIERFAKDFWPPQDLKFGLTSRVPVFIVGFPRSGSTLLETMLDMHPNVAGIGETRLMAFALTRLQRELSALSAQVESGSEAFGRGYRKLVNKHATETLSAMKARSRDLAASANLNASSSEPSNKTNRLRRVVDKTLGNYRQLALLLLLFSKASIIHVHRNPMDTLWSCRKHRFADDGMLYTMREEALVVEYARYVKVMEHYQRVLPERIFDVRYEDLACNPEATLRGVLDHIGLEWDESVLKSHESRRLVRTQSFLQVRQPVYDRSIGAWERYSSHLQPMVELLKKHLPGLEVAPYPPAEQKCKSVTSHEKKGSN